MRKSIGVVVLSAILLAGSAAAALGQGGDLQALAKELSAKSQAARAEAYALAAQKGWPTSGIGENGSFFELQKLVNGIPRFYTTYNANAAISTCTDSVNTAIGGGSGFVLRLWDGGKPLTTHQELTGRVTWADVSPGTVAGHATHVAGTLIASGVLPAAKGMSYQATLRAFEWNNDASEMANEAAGGATVSNHSYGYIAGWYYNTSNAYWYWYGDTAVSEVEDYLFGFYDTDAQAYDQMLNQPSAIYYLPVVSASNDRDDAGPPPGTKHYYWDARFGTWRFSTKTRNPDGTPIGYDCIPFGFQISKNTLTVGAVNDVLTYTGPASVSLADFSSTGPCDDGRIKPDVVGNGVNLTSCYSTNNTSYASASGTSMSSPNVSGSLGLLSDYYKDTHGGASMWASTLKALAIHTTREAGPYPGPDYQYGWGLLNTMAAYRQLNRDYLNDSKGLIEELTLNNGATIEIGYRVVGAPAELRATIVWNDPAGTPPAPAIDPADRMLVNDLDLRAIQGLTTFYPWKLDRANPANAATKADNNVDNVEQVVVTSPTPNGLYTIRISHKGTLYGSSQKVSLVVSGAEKNHVWHVYADGSGDAPTIAAAVSSADDGDSIYVHPGTFPEGGISINKALVITGVGAADLNVVDGTGISSSVFVFPTSAKTIKIRGLAVKHGSGLITGGGMSIENSNVTVEDCIFESNISGYFGGGLAAMNVDPVIRRCVFASNTAGGGGGGIYLYGSNATIDSCVLYGNSVTSGSGSAIYIGTASPQIGNCTLYGNGTGLGAVYVGASATPAIQRCIVASNAGDGIYGATGASPAISCCDVFGNAGSGYAGSISDQTGLNNNIADDPLFCGPGLAPPDLTIATTSPCANAQSPCGQLIGALGTACEMGPDLVFAGVVWSDLQPYYGRDSVQATVKVKNIGGTAAGRFTIDYYRNAASAPPAGTFGDQRRSVAGLAPGDSIEWVTGLETASVFEKWTSWFRVDNPDSVVEMDETNNLSGPHEILWSIPLQPGWPVAFTAGIHSSPAVADLDDDPATLETVFGCDNGTLVVLTSAGTVPATWATPDVGDTLFSSPAVGDIAGDYRKEIVIGALDGKVYAYDWQGNPLWDYATGVPIRTTPALADLDLDGKCEVIVGSGTSLLALEGNGTAVGGSWPVTVASGAFTSPAVGDVNGDGALEVAAIAYREPDAQSSRVYLLGADGSSYGAGWPAPVDTVVVADPVLGDVIGADGDLEIVAGGLDGRVFVWTLDGSLWATPPSVAGAVESSPALANLDGDTNLEILVPSRARVFVDPDWIYETNVTAIDHDGAVMAGWPRTTAGSAFDFGPVPTPIVIGDRVETILGDASQELYSWQSDGAAVYGFPLVPGGRFFASTAADDLDRDGMIELIAPATADAGGLVTVYELDPARYATGELVWPMFRHDRARTACYGALVPTAVDNEPVVTPRVTAIRSIFPNPFNPSTRIAYDVASSGLVEIAIYDIAGRQVSVLLRSRMEPGRYEISWNGRTVSGSVAASGVYFCWMRSGATVETRKMVLLR